MRLKKSTYRPVVITTVLLSSLLSVIILGAPAAAQTVQTTIDGSAAIAGVPLCTDHDPTKYHGLVERNADGSIKCTYGHEHNDDPRVLDSVLGPVGSGFGQPGLEISYPWHTPSEDTMKHELYKWVVRTTLQPWYGIDAKNYFTDFRFTLHFDAFGGHLPAHPDLPAGVQVEYHSFSFEGRVCSPDGNCGTFKMGGVQDEGERLLTHDTQPQYECVLPNPNVQAFCQTSNMAGPRLMAGGINDSRRDQTWYGSNNVGHNSGGPAIDADLGVIGDAWGPVDASRLDQTPPLFYSPHESSPGVVDLVHNAASIQAEVIAFSAGGFPADVNGRINAAGFTDRYGNVVQGCSTATPDCVPFELTNIPVGYTQYRDGEYQRLYAVKNWHSYDVLLNNQSLIQFPN